MIPIRLNSSRDGNNCGSTPNYFTDTTILTRALPTCWRLLGDYLRQKWGLSWKNAEKNPTASGLHNPHISTPIAIGTNETRSRRTPYTRQLAKEHLSNISTSFGEFTVICALPALIATPASSVPC